MGGGAVLGAAALGAGALAELGGAAALTLAATAELETAGPGSLPQLRSVSAAAMQAEREAPPARCLLLLARMTSANHRSHGVSGSWLFAISSTASR